jgi:hypothetical protein
MNTRKILTLVGATLAFAYGQVATAAPGPDAKLWSGTWKLNSAKSKFSASDTSERSETRTYVISRNRVTMHSHFISGAGKPVNWSYSAALDGKAYPTMGNRNADHLMLIPVSEREVRSRTMLRGKASATSSASVSADGKQITMQRSILSAKGGASHDTLVFDRIK